MSQDIERDVKKETEDTLRNVHDITQKIKGELEIISGLLSKNGDLSTAIEGANRKLAQLARKKGIESVDELLILDENQEDLVNFTTVDTITQRLMSIMDS